MNRFAAFLIAFLLSTSSAFGSYASGSGGGGGTWGSITGTLSSQSDLNTALAGKASLGVNTDITSMTGLTGDIKPASDGVGNLGSSIKRWNQGFIKTDFTVGDTSGFDYVKCEATSGKCTFGNSASWIGNGGVNGNTEIHGGGMTVIMDGNGIALYGAVKHGNCHLDPTPVALGNITGATTIDLSTAAVFTATMTGDAPLTLSNGQNGCSYSLRITQDGSHVISGAGITWLNSAGTAPTAGANGKILRVGLIGTATTTADGTYAANY